MTNKVNEPLRGVRVGDFIAVRHGYNLLPDKRVVLRVTPSGRVIVDSYNNGTMTFTPDGKQYPRSRETWSVESRATVWDSDDTKCIRANNDKVKAISMTKRALERIDKMSNAEHKKVIAALGPIVGFSKNSTKGN